MGIAFEDIESGEDVRLNIFVYGVTGSGKTALLGSAQFCESTSPILIIDVDGGLQTLKGSGIKIVRPTSMKEVQEIYDFLRFENTKYRSVGIDSITELQRKLSMGEILGVLKDDFSYTNLDKHVPANQYDWLSSGEQLKRTIRAFRDLAYLPNDPVHRIHVFMTALERYDEKSDTICPSLPGQLGLEVGASVDILGHLSVHPKERRYLLMRNRISESGTKFLGKVRVPVGTEFPRGMWDPDVEKLTSYWTSSSEQTDEDTPQKVRRAPNGRRKAK